ARARAREPPLHSGVRGAGAGPTRDRFGPPPPAAVPRRFGAPRSARPSDVRVFAAAGCTRRTREPRAPRLALALLLGGERAGLSARCGEGDDATLCRAA